MSVGFAKLFTGHCRIRSKVSKIISFKSIRRRSSCAPQTEDLGCPSVDKKGLILGVYTTDNGEPQLTPIAKKFNDCTNGRLMELYKMLCKTLHVGEAYAFYNLDPEYLAVALAGLGSPNLCYDESENRDQGAEAVRQAAAAGSQILKQNNIGRILVEGMGKAEQAAEGSALALWRYQENKNRKDWSIIPSLELYGDDDTESFQRGLFKAECQNLARRLSDTPGNQMTPLHFAQEAVNELCPCGIKVEVHDKDWIESQKMNAFLTVARGSCEPPIFLELSYCGEAEGVKPILLAGKGITFDCGGLFFKEPEKMSEYRADMSGAAVIVGAMKAAAAFSLPLNIQGVIPLCENMASGMAMKSGDIVCSLNSKSIAIEDCDHDGRLIMADALVYGQKAHKPRLVIDVCTLVPGMEHAVGSAATGVFVNSETLWAQVRRAAAITGDRVWRFPLWKHYTTKVTDFRSHDVNNRGYGRASACLAAAFLQEFIECVDWIHFDSSSSGMVSHNKVVKYLTKERMTGRPTRVLIQLLYQLACPAEAKREVKC